MSEKVQSRAPEVDTKSGKPKKSRKTYQKPEFQHEQVFETMALACGKLSPTQFTCHFNRKNS
ncbi:MAG TPA: hypothetical protein VHX36_08450 [Candidatus Acidoferrales bacterium]|jgi:hypothetical protein|nr:hypothetical protein [Candidatus Acidoferrales bacterium]